MTNREPDAWPTRIGAITLFVEDVPAAKEFGRTVFGLPVLYEDADSAVFKFGGHARQPAEGDRGS